MDRQRGHNKELFSAVRSSSTNYFHGTIETYISAIMAKDEDDLTATEAKIKQAVTYGTELAKDQVERLIIEKLQEPVFLLKILGIIAGLVGIGFYLGKNL